MSFQQNTILYSPAQFRATFPISQSTSNIKATMPPKGSKTAKASEAPKRASAPRAAKVGTNDPGACSAASKYVKDVHLHESSDEPKQQSSS